jgi:hypothetical protein
MAVRAKELQFGAANYSKEDAENTNAIFRGGELSNDVELPLPVVMHQIELDLDRTFFSHSTMGVKGGEGQRRMFDVLCVFGRYLCFKNHFRFHFLLFFVVRLADSIPRWATAKAWGFLHPCC